MTQLCITSDIQSIFLLLNYNDLRDVKNLMLDRLNNNVSHLQILGRNIQILKEELEDAIGNLLSNKRPTETTIKRVTESGRLMEFKNITTTVKFKSNIIRVDIRKDYDFQICALMDIYNMAVACSDLEGSLFIYNRELIEKYNGGSIISILRNYNWLDMTEIKKSLKDEGSESNNNNIKSSETIEAALEQLQKFGLVHFDDKQSVYKLTARGYMFR